MIMIGRNAFTEDLGTRFTPSPFAAVSKRVPVQTLHAMLENAEGANPFSYECFRTEAAVLDMV